MILLAIAGTAAVVRPQMISMIMVLILTLVLVRLYLYSPCPDGEDFADVYPKRWASVCLVMYMFFPHLFYKMGNMGLYIQFGTWLIILSSALYHVLKRNNFTWKVSKNNLWLFLIFASVLVSMLFGYLFKGVPRAGRDILAIKDPFYLAFMFTIFFQLDWKASDVRRYFLNPFIAGGIGTVIIGIIQYLQIPGWNENLFAYWTEEQHLMELLKPESRRIFSTFYAAGSYGIFLVFLIAHLLVALSVEDFKRKVLLFSAFILALIALFMTATKGSFIVFLILLVIFPFSLRIRPERKMIYLAAYIPTLVLIVLLSTFLLHETYMLERMQSVGNSVKNIFQYGTSVRLEQVLDETSIGRLAPWVQFYPQIKQSPVFGYGPGKVLMRESGIQYRESQTFKNPFESSYLQITFRFGLIGLILNLGLIIHFIRIQQGLLKRKDLPVEIYRLATAHVLYSILLFLIFFNTDCIFNINLMVPVYASAGIGGSILRDGV